MRDVGAESHGDVQCYWSFVRCGEICFGLVRGSFCLVSLLGLS